VVALQQKDNSADTYANIADMAASHAWLLVHKSLLLLAAAVVVGA
jgi:hypothetical protein